MDKIKKAAKKTGTLILAAIPVKIAYDVIWPFLRNFFMGLGNGLVVAFNNAIALLARDVNSMTYPTLLMSFLSVAMFTFPILTFLRVRSEWRRRLGEIASNLKPTENKTVSTDVKDIDNKLEEIEEDFHELKKAIKREEKSVYAYIITACVFAILFFITTAVPMSHRKTFESSIDKISPYITDNEIKSIKSRWTLMENYEDYLSIQNDMKDICETHGIKY